MSKFVWRRERPFNGTFLAFVAPILDHSRDVDPNGIADREIYNMASAKPRHYEKAKNEICNGSIPEIFETFCNLRRL
jgi:hypothetical protein